jgi:hypothetical protein
MMLIDDGRRELEIKSHGAATIRKKGAQLDLDPLGGGLGAGWAVVFRRAVRFRTAGRLGQKLLMSRGV